MRKLRKLLRRTFTETIYAVTKFPAINTVNRPQRDFLYGRPRTMNMPMWEIPKRIDNEQGLWVTKTVFPEPVGWWSSPPETSDEMPFLWQCDRRFETWRWKKLRFGTSINEDWHEPYLIHHHNMTLDAVDTDLTKVFDGVIKKMFDFRNSPYTRRSPSSQPRV